MHWMQYENVENPINFNVRVTISIYGIYQLQIFQQEMLASNGYLAKNKWKMDWLKGMIDRSVLYLRILPRVCGRMYKSGETSCENGVKSVRAGRCHSQCVDTHTLRTKKHIRWVATWPLLRSNESHGALSRCDCSRTWSAASSSVRVTRIFLPHSRRSACRIVIYEIA